jgi:hypothetical protein
MVIGCQAYQVSFNKCISFKCTREKEKIFLSLDHVDRLWDDHNLTCSGYQRGSPILKGTRA